MLEKMKIMFLAMMLFILPCVSFASTLPLNTGYDYSNYNVYPANGTPDDYWIRIASYTPVSPNVGPSWAIAGLPLPTWAAPMNGPTGIPSTWINAFGPNYFSPGTITTTNLGYAIYRKCFCLPANYGQAAIRGNVKADDTLQIWLNSQMNTVVAPSGGAFPQSAPPVPIAYANQSAFRKGSNCLYVLVEDAGGATGLNLAANVTATGPSPIGIAKGVNMLYEPCGCNTGVAGPGGVKSVSKELARTAEPNDDDVVKSLIKFAESRRLERLKTAPKN